MSETATTLVDLRAVSKSYGDRVVLHECDFQVSAGEMVAVVGPSGSGKSTLLAIVAGLERPDAGEHTPLPRDRRQCWIPQSSPMLSHRPAIDNVALGPLSFGLNEAESRTLAKDALAELGIAHLAPTKAYRLSGGERQRMVVARSIAARADLILADEPTASLDGANRDLVVEALRKAAALGSAVVIATHDMDVARGADRIVKLSPRAVAVGGETP